MNGARSHLQTTTGREPSLEELSDFVGKSPGEVHCALSAHKTVFSYDVPIGPGEYASLSDHLADESSSEAENMFMEDALKKNILHLLQILPERERYVVERRYGLDGGGCTTLAEIGAGIGLTRERVRQIQNSALRRLRSRASQAEV